MLNNNPPLDIRPEMLPALRLDLAEAKADLLRLQKLYGTFREDAATIAEPHEATSEAKEKLTWVDAAMPKQATA